MKTYLFPGQGSQAKGMGKDLFDKYKDLTEVADRVLGYSIKELCLDDPRKELNQTQFTQPAIYVVNALSYIDKLEQFGKPDFVAGHSLGEFNALLAAECFGFETGLRLVQRRAQLMSRAAEGAMAAILNATVAEIEAILAENGLDEIDIANFNTPMQTVISGSKRQIVKAQDFFQGGKMQYIPLNTSGAFHSRFMAPAREQFETFLASFDFRQPTIPVIANISARPYENGSVAANLGRQITGSVRWSETIQYLMGVAAASGKEMEFTEVGHGNVLTNLVHKIKADAPPIALPASEARRPEVPAAPPAANPQEKVHLWNQKHPIGTRVRSTIIDADFLETRTEAMVLFQHRAAVYLKGYNGYFDLDELVLV